MNSVIKSVTLSLIAQISSIISGLIIPRLILSTFGSEVNGLISSITQFLNYISLLEGGVTGVVMAALYKPLNENDSITVSGILKAVNLFFRKIGCIYCVYAVCIGIIYPLIVNTSFAWDYVFSLTVILALNLMIQYFLSLSYKVLLDADRKTYVTSFVGIISVWVNLIVTVIAIRVFPEIHFVKFIGALVLLLQPVLYVLYVKRNYNLRYNIAPDNSALKHRWDGMGQNIAYFIHTNTDVVILTFFSSLSNVSVYSIYFMVANSLKGLIMAIARVISPIIGNKIASDRNDLNDTIDAYELLLGLITLFAYANAVNLILPFVKLYTAGIHDANYNQPLFAFLLLLAEAVYCFREPYVSFAYAAGHFRETSTFAYFEAILNLFISICLVRKLGLIGIATGTFVSMLYRLIAHVFYLKKNIVHRPIKKAFKFQIRIWCTMAASITIYNSVCRFIMNNEITGWTQWVIFAAISCIITGITILLFFYRNLRLILAKKGVR